MRDGYRIIDTDTHVGPTMEVLEKYASAALRNRWAEFEPYLQKGSEGSHLSVNPVPFDRPMRQGRRDQTAEAGGKIPLKGKTSPLYKESPRPGVQNENVEDRLSDMDHEGVDVNLIIPATFPNASTVLDLELHRELCASYHRYLGDYCGTEPDRLKGALLAPARDPQWSVQEIERLASERWAAAVIVLLPEEMPIDDPELDPIWAAMNDADFPLLHHSFFYEPPYFPGYRDVWGNIVVARAAAHPWGAQRLLAYLLLSGVFDEFPNLRVGFAECGAGWLSFWLRRLKAQADYMHGVLPERSMNPVEYAQAGRVYAGLELYEGEELARSVIDVAGDGVLMYQSDYPHAQCEFPDSPASLLSWGGLSETEKRKILSENPERYLRMT